MHEDIMMNEDRPVFEISKDSAAEPGEIIGVMKQAHAVIAAPDQVDHGFRWQYAGWSRHARHC